MSGANTFDHMKVLGGVKAHHTGPSLFESKLVPRLSVIEPDSRHCAMPFPTIKQFASAPQGQTFILDLHDEPRPQTD
jgi:hypothetical protein